MSLTRSLSLVVAALALAACPPKRPAPVPGVDSATSDTLRPDSIADTVTIDTGHASALDSAGTPDSLVWPGAYRGHAPSVMTAADVAALTRAAAAPHRRRTPARGGIPFGFSGYKPTDRWCGGFLNASNMTLAPQYLRSTLRAAEQCGYRFAPAMMRALMTTNGRWNGPFSLTRAKSSAKAYSDALTESEWAHFAPLIPYVYGLDDMGCAACWGGAVISQQTTAAFYAYVQTLTMAKYVPMALRVHPEWMLRNGMTKASWSMPDGSPRVDRTISQWYGIFQTQRPYRTQQQWYEVQRLVGANANVPAQSYTVAYGGCWNASTLGCSADKIKTTGLVANAFPGNCENIGWNYRGEFDHEPYVSNIRTLALDAAGRTRSSACTLR